MQEDIFAEGPAISAIFSQHLLRQVLQEIMDERRAKIKQRLNFLEDQHWLQDIL